MYSTPSILGCHFGRIGGKERKEMALWDTLLKFKDQTIRANNLVAILKVDVNDDVARPPINHDSPLR